MSGTGVKSSGTVTFPATAIADLVAVWHIKLSDGMHRVEFVHGTTSGRRVIKIDGQETRRKNYMFKLVGQEEFSIAGIPCHISIEAVPNMRYQYKLHVNGQTYERYEETTARNYKIWKFPASGVAMYQIAFDAPVHGVSSFDCTDTQTLEIRVNGNIVETASDFTDTGSQLSFTLGSDFAATVKITTANFQRSGLGTILYVDGHEIPLHHES